MNCRNDNAARKIDVAIRRGWVPALRCGPCRFLRLSRVERSNTLRAAAAKADNRWRPSPVQREEQEAA
jgi:hypothetical protein